MTASAANNPIIKGSLVSTSNYTWNTADSLGRGASAIVYLGRHNATGKLVAVKVFHEYVHMGCNEDDRELMLLRKLNHPNVIKLLDIEKLRNLSTNKCVLVLEYCEGSSVHHMLDMPSHFYGLQESEFLRVLTHVSAGIQYLRKENVIHRDIKPGNIMRYITEDGFSIYKLTDFGAARNLDDSESFQSLYGTEEYLHPAIYEKAVLKLPTAQSFDAKVDLWSLGVTFYHTATGQLPFQAFGGRNNRHTMFDIISQKESGVISGVQKSEGGAIEWKSDLPETSPLTSGLKSIIIPLLAGLMEPNEGKMLTYEAMFRIVLNIDKKTTVTVFHYNRCEELVIYVEPSTGLAGLRDEIASLTDIPSAEQILLVGGHLLERVIDPLAPVSSYPENLRTAGVYLFQREMPEVPRLAKPTIHPFPSFISFGSIEEDARLAHNCAAKGELMKRYTERVSNNQHLLMDGLMCLRVFVESRLAETQTCQDFMVQLMNECEYHYDTLFQLVQSMRNSLFQMTNLHLQGRDGTRSDTYAAHPDVQLLDSVLNDTAIQEVFKKARDRIQEIQQYRDMLKKKIEDIKSHASQFSAVCEKEKCSKKVKHHLGQISTIQSRFRRDRSVKHQMTDHDQKIHGFERQKLSEQCDKIRHILTHHCLPHLDTAFKNGLQLCESLTKCLMRVQKIEKNVNSVLNCQKLLTDKLRKQKSMCTSELKSLESGYASCLMTAAASPEHPYQQLVMSSVQPGQSDINIGGFKANQLASVAAFNGQIGLSSNVTDGFQSVSGNARDLEVKLRSIQDVLAKNSQLLSGLDETSLPSSGSLAQSTEETMDDEMG